MTFNIDTLKFAEDHKTWLTFTEGEDNTDFNISQYGNDFYNASKELIKWLENPGAKLTANAKRIIMFLHFRKGIPDCHSVFRSDKGLTPMYFGGFACKLLFGVKKNTIEVKEVTINHNIAAFNVMVDSLAEIQKDLDIIIKHADSINKYLDELFDNYVPILIPLPNP
jgi:hypothetical protein